MWKHNRSGNDMKILIISDTHRQNDNFFKVIEQVGKIDLLIHLGDVEGSEYAIEQAAGCPVEMVSGNNDFFSELSSEKIITIGKYKALLTHGHRYYIGMGNQMLKQEAIAQGVDIVMYGHTHKPVVEIDDHIIAVNPGSLSYPRQENRRPSYIIMTLEGNHKPEFEIHYL